MVRAARSPPTIPPKCGNGMVNLPLTILRELAEGAPEQLLDGWRQLRKSAYDVIRIELRDGRVGIAEIDRDHRDCDSPRGRDVGQGIPYHDGALAAATDTLDGAAQDGGIGLWAAEGVGAADRAKAPR